MSLEFSHGRGIAKFSHASGGFRALVRLLIWRIGKVFGCRQIKNRLGRYHDGELPPDERLLVERHLQDCRLCGQELEEIRKLSMSFQRALVIPPVPEDLVPRILAQAGAQAGAPFSALDVFRLWRGWSLSMRLAAMAVAAAACYIGLVIGSASLPSRRSAGDEMQWVGMASRGPITTAYVGTTR